MKTRILIAAAAVAAFGFSGGAFAADVAAGKAKVDGVCADCHDGKGDEHYVGKSAADLEASLKAIVAGTKKHKKKLTLSDAEIQNIVAYLTSK